MQLRAVGIHFAQALPFTPCLLASLVAEEQRINGVVGGVGGLFAQVDALVVVVERKSARRFRLDA